MKYLLLLVFVGVMMGQEKPVCSKTAILNMSHLSTTEGIELNGELCRPMTGQETLTQKNTWDHPDDSFPPTCKKVVEPDGWECRIDSRPRPEAPDVPALTKTQKQCVTSAMIVASDSFVCSGNAGSSCPCGHYEDVPYQTCADPTRILEHDEQAPPKYYCRKVQTGAASLPKKEGE